MLISIIIPTYNEQQLIVDLINYLSKNGQGYISEIIVANYGYEDETVNNLKDTDAIIVHCKQKSRAIQMNTGAKLAKGDVLYFVHADSYPPITFAEDIITCITKGYDCGRFKTKFSTNSLGLRFNAFFTQFDLFVCYGGDQTFFITNSLFNNLHGYDETYKIMEDYHITTRAKKLGKYCVLQKNCIINTRKYDNNSWWQVMKANKKMIAMYKANENQNVMVTTYKNMLNNSNR